MPTTVRIYMFGQGYEVPVGITVLEAMEAVGISTVHHSGCRAGVCGACAVLYRLQNSYEIRSCLACRTAVEEGMTILAPSQTEVSGGTALLSELSPTRSQLRMRFPTLSACMECRACDRACPQQLPVMQYVRAAREGNYALCAELSFACVMCGMCTQRCPMKIPQPQVAMVARRIHGAYLLPPSEALEQRIRAIREGEYDATMEELCKASEDELRVRYEQRSFSD